MSRHENTRGNQVFTFVEKCLEFGFSLVLREVGLSRTLRVGRLGGGSSPVGTSYFSILQDNQAGSGSHPTSSGYRDSFPGIKLAERDIDHTVMECRS